MPANAKDENRETEKNYRPAHARKAVDFSDLQSRRYVVQKAVQVYKKSTNCFVHFGHACRRQTGKGIPDASENSILSEEAGRYEYDTITPSVRTRPDCPPIIGRPALSCEGRLWTSRQH